MLQIPILQIVLEMYEHAAKLYNEGNLSKFEEYVSQKSMKHGLCNAITEIDPSAENFIYYTAPELIKGVAEKLGITPYDSVYIAFTPINSHNIAKIKEGIDIRIKVLKYMIENKIV